MILTAGSLSVGQRTGMGSGVVGRSIGEPLHCAIVTHFANRNIQSLYAEDRV